MIERKVRAVSNRRLKEELLEKNRRIGELLGLDLVPLHTLAWQEPKLETGTGDCYPMVDILERIAELLNKGTAEIEAPPVAKKTRKSKKG